METQDFDCTSSSTATWQLPRDITIRAAQISTACSNLAAGSGYYTVQLRYTAGNAGNPAFVQNASGAILTCINAYSATSWSTSSNANIDNLSIKLKKGQIVTMIANGFSGGPSTGSVHGTLYYE